MAFTREAKKIPLQRDCLAAWQAVSVGAVQQAERYGLAEQVHVGTDYFNADGEIVLQSMTAAGNPQ
jgi:hypothetical protein